MPQCQPLRKVSSQTTDGGSYELEEEIKLHFIKKSYHTPFLEDQDNARNIRLKQWLHIKLIQEGLLQITM